MVYRKIAISLFLLVSFASTANAYIDMGTGSYLIQILLASLLAVGIGIRAFWDKIKSFFSSKSSKKGQENG